MLPVLTEDDLRLMAATFSFDSNRTIMSSIVQWQRTIEETISMVQESSDIYEYDLFWDDYIDDFGSRLVIQIVIDSTPAELGRRLAAAVKPSDDIWLSVSVPVPCSLIGRMRKYYTERGANTEPYWFELRVPRNVPQSLIEAICREDS